MKEQGKYDWMVYVSCMTFNHAPYIEDAMNGFTMQETDFPFVCAVVDDASTDGEPEVIKKYLEENFDLEDKSIVRNDETDDYHLTFARHKTNLNCYFAVLFLKYNHYSIKKPKLPYIEEWRNKAKYIAICEGDDYWIVANKLQKQVVFLEENSDYIISSHDYIRYCENEKKFNKQSDNKSYLDREINKEDTYIKFSLDNYFEHWFTQPLTCLYRNGDYLKTIPQKLYKFYRDDIFFYYVLKVGKGALFRDVMGVYRINDSGTWSTKSSVMKWKDSIYNAYNIYIVEGDKRALIKMNNLEGKVVFHYLHSLKISCVLEEFWKFAKMVPLNYYLLFIFSFLRLVLSTMKKKISAFFHFNKS